MLKKLAYLVHFSKSNAGCCPDFPVSKRERKPNSRYAQDLVLPSLAVRSQETLSLTDQEVSESDLSDTEVPQDAGGLFFF